MVRANEPGENRRRDRETVGDWATAQGLVVNRITSSYFLNSLEPMDTVALHGKGDYGCRWR